MLLCTASKGFLVWSSSASIALLVRGCSSALISTKLPFDLILLHENWFVICDSISGDLLTFYGQPPRVRHCYNGFIQISICSMGNRTPVVVLLLPLLMYNELIHSTCWRIVWSSCCSLTLVYRNFRLLTHQAASCPGSQAQKCPYSYNIGRHAHAVSNKIEFSTSRLFCLLCCSTR